MLFVTQTAEAVISALRSATVRGKVAVIDELRLARALRDRGADVVAIGTRIRALKKSAGPRICGATSALPVARGALGAVVATGVGDSEAWEADLGRLSESVTDGGLVVLVDRAAPPELSRRALCGGLARIEQRQAGRIIITTGRVAKLGADGR